MVGPNLTPVFSRSIMRLAGQIVIWQARYCSHLNIGHSWVSWKMSKGQIGHWIKQNTDRDHFFLAANNKHLLAALESLLITRLLSVFER